jgi:hypothetical protein
VAAAVAGVPEAAEVAPVVGPVVAVRAVAAQAPVVVREARPAAEQEAQAAAGPAAGRREA